MKKNRKVKIVLLFGFILTLIFIYGIFNKLDWIQYERGRRILRQYDNTRESESSIENQTHAQSESDKLINEKTRRVTAYNVGDNFQCSGDPCISANGENICLALDLGYRRCAANFVDFGVRLFIEKIGECLVTDRLSSRYPQTVDLAMRLDEKERALKFGRQRLNVKVLERVY